MSWVDFLKKILFPYLPTKLVNTMKFKFKKRGK